MNDSLDATHIDLTSAYLDLVDAVNQVAIGRPIILHQNGTQVARDFNRGFASVGALD